MYKVSDWCDRILEVIDAVADREQQRLAAFGTNLIAWSPVELSSKVQDDLQLDALAAHLKKRGNAVEAAALESLSTALSRVPSDLWLDSGAGTAIDNPAWVEAARIAGDCSVALKNLLPELREHDEPAPNA